MASPPIPPSLEHLAGRSFSFYPAIVNVEHNEWQFRRATWSEIQVVNCHTSAEVWISRRFLGDVSRVEDPVLIVGLNRELELKGGMVVPFQRRIIEMPVAVNAPAPPRSTGDERSEPAPVVGIRLEPNDRRVFRLILVAAGTLVGLSVAAVAFTHMGEIRQKNVVYVGSDQSYLSLSGRDDYLSVVQKLGASPATDHTEETGTILYRALGYPDRHYTIILMGADESSMTYIGAVDQNWHAIRSVNSHTDALLRGLKRF